VKTVIVAKPRGRQGAAGPEPHREFSDSSDEYEAPAVKAVIAAKPRGQQAAAEQGLRGEFSDSSDEYEAPAANPRSAHSVEEIMRRYLDAESEDGSSG
jgi:hypothetical protein